MKKAEQIFIAVVIFAIILKYLHLPASGILLILSLSCVSIIYMYLGFAFFNQIKLKEIFKKETYKDISAKRIIGGILAGLALSFAAMGILFKFQTWPGASMQLGFGIFGLSIISVISLIKRKSSHDNFYSKILKRAFFFGAICIILVSIPTKPWLEWKYHKSPDYVKAILEAQADPNNQELWDEVDKQREIMLESRKYKGY